MKNEQNPNDASVFKDNKNFVEFLHGTLRVCCIEKC